MLELDNVSITKGTKKILDHVTMAVSAGQVVVIIGPNGAGKSSALKAMTGDYKPDFGRVSLNNRPLKQFSFVELAQLRAVMSQSYEMNFPFSVHEVIEMGAFAFANQLSQYQHQAMFKEVTDLLDVSALLKRNFPHLSGGEQQRVQLARVLLQLFPALERVRKKQATAPYLLIDEPTASLDLFHQYQVMKVAKKMANKGAGVVVVLHDLSLAASFADVIYVMQQGRVVAQGAPAEVLQPDILQSVYQIRAHLHRPNHYFPHLQISTVV